MIKKLITKLCHCFLPVIRAVYQTCAYYVIYVIFSMFSFILLCNSSFLCYRGRCSSDAVKRGCIQVHNAVVWLSSYGSAWALQEGVKLSEAFKQQFGVFLLWSFVSYWTSASIWTGMHVWLSCLDLCSHAYCFMKSVLFLGWSNVKGPVHTYSMN